MQYPLHVKLGFHAEIKPEDNGSEKAEALYHTSKAPPPRRGDSSLGETKQIPEGMTAL